MSLSPEGESFGGRYCNSGVVCRFPLFNYTRKGSTADRLEKVLKLSAGKKLTHTPLETDERATERPTIFLGPSFFPIGNWSGRFRTSHLLQRAGQAGGFVHSQLFRLKQCPNSWQIRDLGSSRVGSCDPPLHSSSLPIHQPPKRSHKTPTEEDLPFLTFPTVRPSTTHQHGPTQNTIHDAPPTNQSPPPQPSLPNPPSPHRATFFALSQT